MNIVRTGRRISVVAIAAAIATTASAGFAPKSSSEVVNKTERAFTLRFADGSKENYVVSYSGEVTVTWREDGQPSTLTHPIDNRQCHWEVSGAITRHVALISKTGVYARKDLETVYAAAMANKGSDFKVVNLHSENCGEANDRRQSDVRNLQSRVRSDFNGTVAEDLKAVKKVFRSSTDVVKVEGI